MKSVIVIISIIIAWLLGVAAVAILVVAGVNFAYIIIKEALEDDKHSKIFGLFSYTALVISLGLLIRWAFV